MKFLVDAQLPGTLARWLRGRGCDAVHVLEREMSRLDDASIWETSICEERILITLNTAVQTKIFTAEAQRSQRER